MKLSLRALGCWLVISNMKKNGENVTIKQIAEKTESSATSIRNAIAELTEKGYLDRKFLRENGRIRGVSYIIKSQPKVKEAAHNG